MTVLPDFSTWLVQQKIAAVEELDAIADRGNPSGGRDSKKSIRSGTQHPG